MKQARIKGSHLSFLFILAHLNRAYATAGFSFYDVSMVIIFIFCSALQTPEMCYSLKLCHHNDLPSEPASLCVCTVTKPAWHSLLTFSFDPSLLEEESSSRLYWKKNPKKMSSSAISARDFRLCIERTIKQACAYIQSEKQRMKANSLHIKHARRPSTLPSPLATTPSLLPTLQLSCLKVAGFRGLAHTNHRYALLCSAARSLKISTSCLSHTSWSRLP